MIQYFVIIHYPPPPSSSSFTSPTVLRSDKWDFGASLSPDGRRCAFFNSEAHLVDPGCILALVADYARFLPGIQRQAAITDATAAAVEGVAVPKPRPLLRPSMGIARTVTASRAVDRVAAKRGVPMHVTPPAWRHVDSLLEAGRLALFGDNSFQMGSFHARVPDGIWATLAVMTALAVAEAQAAGAVVEEVEAEEKEENEAKQEKVRWF